MNTEARAKLLDQLKDLKAKGMLGVAAAKACVPEWVLRDWCDNSMYTPTLIEMQKVQEALDNRKRETPINGAPADVGKEPAFP